MDNYINIKEKKPKHGEQVLVRLGFFGKPEYKAKYDVYVFCVGSEKYQYRKDKFETFTNDTFIKRKVGAIKINQTKLSELKDSGQSVVDIVKQCIEQWESIIDVNHCENYHIYWKPL